MTHRIEDIRRLYPHQRKLDHVSVTEIHGEEDAWRLVEYIDEGDDYKAPIHELYHAKYEWEDVGGPESGPKMSRSLGPWKLVSEGMGKADDIVDEVAHHLYTEEMLADHEREQNDATEEALENGDLTLVEPEEITGEVSVVEDITPGPIDDDIPF